MSESEPVTPQITGGPSQSTRRALFVAILLTAAFLRLYRLDDLPPPMDADEASRGYDAWSLWQTGRDQFGEFMPALLRSFGPGDYTAAASAYLCAPVTGIVGPGVFGIRLTTALAGVATIALVYFWLFRERGGRLALAAAALLAVNPWHVRMSRWAHEAHLTPFLLAAGFYFASRAGFLFTTLRHADSLDENELDGGQQARQHNPNIARAAWAFAAGLAFGVGAWAYHAPRLVIPFLLLAIAIAVLPRVILNMARSRTARPVIAALVLGLVVGTLPISLTLLRHPERLVGRVQFTSVFSPETLKSAGPGSTQSSDFGSRLFTAARQYLWYFDPVMLAWDSEVEQGATAKGYSRLTIPETVLLGVGVLRLLLTCRRDRLHRLLLVWLLLYPVPAALSVGPAASSLRAVCGLPVMTIVEAVGAMWLLARPRTRWVLGILAAGTVIHGAATARFYVTDLPKILSHRNHEELFDAFQWAAQIEPEPDAIYVTPRANQPQALMLVATHFDPRRLHKSIRTDIPWNAGFDQTLQIDKWHFLPKRGQDPWQLDDLPELLAAHPPGSRILILCRPYSTSRMQFECPWGEVLRTFSARDGHLWLEARAVVTGNEGDVRENRPGPRESSPTPPP